MKKYVIITIAFFLFSAACKEKAPEIKKVTVQQVETEQAKIMQIAIPVISTGFLNAKVESKLSFKTGGIISEINVNEGDYVKKGTVLAILNLEEIEANVNKAKLGLEKSTRDFERAERLYNDTVATLEQFQDAGTALDLAKSNLKIANFNLKYSRIVAPENGRILKQISQENEIIAPGYPLFLFASEKENWVIRVNVSDKDILKIKEDDQALVIFDAIKGQKIEGVVSEIASMSDPYTGTYEVEIKIIAGDLQLKSGFIGKVQIIPSETISLIEVPIESLIEAYGDNGMVFIYKDGKAVKRKVRIHHIGDSSVFIQQGIMENEEVVTQGSSYIEEGVLIEKVK